MADRSELIALGAQIKKVRQSKGITQAVLGYKCDIEKATLSKIESGKINPSYRTLLRISGGLEVDITTLMPHNGKD
jgi:transcriptional regulator with XRE-family HTH domain